MAYDSLNQLNLSANIDFGRLDWLPTFDIGNETSKTNAADPRKHSSSVRKICSAQCCMSFIYTDVFTRHLCPK